MDQKLMNRILLRGWRRRPTVRAFPKRSKCDLTGQHYRYKAAKQKIRREHLHGVAPALCSCGNYVIV